MITFSMSEKTVTTHNSNNAAEDVKASDRLLQAIHELQSVHQRKQRYGAWGCTSEELQQLILQATPLLGRCSNRASSYDGSFNQTTVATHPLVKYAQGLCTCLQAPGIPRQAIPDLQAAVKLQPSLTDAWSTLAHCYWECGELGMARNCLMTGLRLSLEPSAGSAASAAPRRNALLQLSMLVRQQQAADASALPAVRGEALALSRDLARAAVELDVTDGYSWYVLALAQLGLYLQAPLQLPGSSSSRPRELQHLLGSFQQAERCGLSDLGDLYFNRAALHTYNQDFPEALKDYRCAQELDPSLPTQAEVEAILTLVSQLSSLVTNKGGVKHKQWSKITAVLAKDAAKASELLSKGLMHHEGLSLAGLTSLKPGGVNRGMALLCRPLVFIAPPLNASATLYLVCVDTAGSCFALALVRVSHDAFNMSQLLTVVHPELHNISVTIRGQAHSFPLIKVDAPNMMLVDGVPVHQEAHAPTSLHAL